MGRIGLVDNAASLPMPAGTWFRLTIAPIVATTPATALQTMADNNPALIQGGAIANGATGGRLTLEGRSALDWQYVRDFLASLEQLAYAAAPYSAAAMLEADVFPAVTTPTPAPTTPTTPAPTPTTPATTSTTPAQAPTAGLASIPAIYWLAGLGLLWFAFGGKGRK